MAWLLAGALLLMAAGRPLRRPLTGLQAGASLLLLMAMPLSLLVYPIRTAATAFGIAAGLALALAALNVRTPGRHLEVAATVMGTAFILFALLGPADGLF